MRLIVEHNNFLKENLNSPREGIFWFIDNKLYMFTDPVDITGRFSTTLDHRKLWNEIKFSHVIGGIVVPYNYYPRGRVMVNPIYNSEQFHHYDVYIYIDNCINEPDILDEIKWEFRLNKNCEIQYIGSEGGVTGDHYKCHKCCIK